jgi:hypothetical protein
VVDYGIKSGLYVVINSHWDMGWLESHIEVASKDKVNKRQGAYWRQIATAFKDYDHHLLFAGANEPGQQDAYGTAWGAERIAVLNSYHQTFIDTVRATGGNNATRTLIVQGPKTDIELTQKEWTTLPVDKVAGRLMAEVHFYPYQFTLMEKDEDWGKIFWFWGEGNNSTTAPDRNTTWCGPAYVDSMFKIVKTQFVDKDIPVMLGEFGAMKRMTLTGDTLALHIKSRRAYYQYVVKSALAHGIIPVAWDAGGKGDLTMTVFDRKTGGVFDLGLLNAIRRGAGLTNLPGDTSLVPVAGTNAMKILYSAKDSLFGQVNLGVPKPNFSAYDSIIVRAYVNGKSTYVEAGATKYGYLSLSLVTMSTDSWKWREAALGTLTNDGWNNYRIPLSSVQADTAVKGTLVPADPTKVNFFGLQAYSKGYNGTIYVDYIVFKTKAGVSDTVYPFNIAVPETFSGNVISVSSIPVGSVASDVEWKTATKSYGSTGIALRGSNSSALVTSVANGKVRTSFAAPEAGLAQVTLTNLLGETVWSHSFAAQAGLNSVEIPSNLRGLGLLQVRMGDRNLTGKVYCP